MATDANREFQPITFTREVDGEAKELTAHSPADAVKLRFDGWREKPGSASKSAAAKSTSSTKTAGTAGA